MKTVLTQSILMLLFSAICFAPAAQAELVTIHSQNPAADEAGAIDTVRREVAAAVLPEIRRRVDTALQKRTTAMIAPSDGAIQNLIMDRLSSTEGAMCVNVRRESRSYGSFYMGTGEVDLADEWVNLVVADSLKLAKVQQQKAVNSTAAVTALVAVIGLVYFATNAFTRGYYQWRLRLAAAASSVAGIAAVIAVYFGV